MQVIKILSGKLCIDPRDVLPLLDVAPPYVIVHGGGPQLDASLQELSEPIKRINGLRVTSAAAADIVARTLDEVGGDLADRMQAMGQRTRHLRADRRHLRAEIEDPRLGRVGVLVDVDTDAIEQAAKEVDCIVLTPVGWDGEGPINVNADDAATAIAQALGADVLTLATDVDGVLDTDGQALRRIDATDAKRLVKQGVAKGGMIPKLRAAVQAVSQGVGEVRIGRIECAVDPLLGTAVEEVVRVPVTA